MLNHQASALEIPGSGLLLLDGSWLLAYESYGRDGLFSWVGC